MQSSASPDAEDLHLQLLQLRERNRRQRSPSLDEQTAQLRLQMGQTLLSGASKTARIQSPEKEIPRIDCEGLPEVSGEKLCAKTLRSALQHQGVLIVRSLFSEEQLSPLRMHSETVDNAENDDIKPWACSSSELFDLLEIYQDSGLLTVIADYLEAEPLLFAERAKLRKHSVEKDLYAVVKWHQDISFFGKECRGINSWAAVTPCGEDNPGLAFVSTRLHDHPGWNGESIAPLDYGSDLLEEYITELSKKHPIICPVLQPGDAVLFDEMTLHSTAVRPWKRSTQVVAISWFFPPHAFPAWGTPLAAC